MANEPFVDATSRISVNADVIQSEIQHERPSMMLRRPVTNLSLPQVIAVYHSPTMSSYTTLLTEGVRNLGSDPPLRSLRFHELRPTPLASRSICQAFATSDGAAFDAPPQLPGPLLAHADILETVRCA